MGGVASTKRNPEYKEILQPELFDDYYLSFFGINILNVALWGKLYRRSLFTNTDLKPSGMKMGEDLILNMKIFPFVNKYVTIPQNVYMYRYGGLTSRFNKSLYHDLKAQYYIKKEEIEKHSYFKAVNSIKIEMCNVLCSNISQMLQYKTPLNSVYSFIGSETESGFIAEITENVDYNKETFHLLKNGEIDKLIAVCKQKTIKQKIIHLLSPILRYI